jgi:hypothetical protein
MGTILYNKISNINELIINTQKDIFNVSMIIDGSGTIKYENLPQEQANTKINIFYSIKKQNSLYMFIDRLIKHEQVASNKTCKFYVYVVSTVNINNNELINKYQNILENTQITIYILE